jgi:hypothetical protein
LPSLYNETSRQTSTTETASPQKSVVPKPRRQRDRHSRNGCPQFYRFD